MKYLLISFLLVGCNIKTGSGVTREKIVDVKWEGLWWKTCEVDCQYGDNSSKMDQNSSLDKALCDRLSKMIGKTVDLSYDHYMHPFPYESNSIIKEVTETK